MNVDNLKKQIKVLLDDADNPNGARFSLSAWAVPADHRLLDSSLLDHDLGDRRWAASATTIPVSCGTMACAFGLSALLGTFKDQGLGYMIDYVGNMIPELTDEAGNKHLAYSAAAILFDITQTDAMYLFDPSCYNSTPEEAEGEREVAQRIEDFITGNIVRRLHPDYKYENDDPDEDDED